MREGHCQWLCRSGLALTCQLPYFYSLFCNLSWWFECLVVNNRLVNSPPASSQCIPAILYLFLFVCISLFLKESIAFFIDLTFYRWWQLAYLSYFSYKEFCGRSSNWYEWPNLLRGMGKPKIFVSIYGIFHIF